jgi:hypothetical protein
MVRGGKPSFAKICPSHSVWNFIHFPVFSIDEEDSIGNFLKKIKLGNDLLIHQVN